MKSSLRGFLAILVACIFVQQVLAAGAHKAKETVLHSFGSGTDGYHPAAAVIDVSGTLYGTAPEGGAYGPGGIVYALDSKTGMETLLHSFGNGTDGKTPVAPLLDVNGTLFGTTAYGGIADEGTVFSVDPTTGQEKVLYSFCSLQACADGENPSAGLINANGILYGTTGAGGAKNGGSVFSLNPATGVVTVLYSFCAQEGCADGQRPLAGLTVENGILYGTTWEGGTSFYGVLFALDPSTGTETVLHSFIGGTDGSSPEASLVDFKGKLYGTTTIGGGTGCQNEIGCGTVFVVDPTTNKEKNIYSFCSRQYCNDGANPYAGLIASGGHLYGTTTAGGVYGGGAVFTLAAGPDTEKVLYSFCRQKNCRDGAYPNASLVDVKGTLYGTTEQGGANQLGTLFAVGP